MSQLNPPHEKELLTELELLKASEEALNFVKENISTDGLKNWDLIYDLKAENIKLQLIISKFKV